MRPTENNPGLTAELRNDLAWNTLHDAWQRGAAATAACVYASYNDRDCHTIVQRVLAEAMCKSLLENLVKAAVDFDDEMRKLLGMAPAQ